MGSLGLYLEHFECYVINKRVSFTFESLFFSDIWHVKVQNIPPNLVSGMWLKSQLSFQDL